MVLSPPNIIIATSSASLAAGSVTGFQNVRDAGQADRDAYTNASIAMGAT